MVVAAETGSEEVVEMMMKEYRVDINAECYGQTALFYVIENGQEEMVEFLIQHGADIINGPSTGGYNALSLAVYKGNRAIVDNLMKRGAFSSFQTVGFEAKHHPLVAAVSGESEDLVKFFLDLGCSVEVLEEAFHNACRFGLPHLATLLLDYASSINAEIIHPCSVMYATCSGDMDTVKLLLNLGADVNGKNPTAQITALAKGAEYGFTDIVRLLLHNGAHVNDESGHSRALAMAAYENHLDIATSLLKRGAGTEFKMLFKFNEYIVTPLLATVGITQTEMVKLLLDYNADFNTEYEDGEGLICCALTNRTNNEGGVELAEYLVMHMVWMKCENLFVSDNNWQATSENEEFAKFQSDFEKEMKALKAARFADSEVSFYEAFKAKSDSQLLIYTGNVEAMRVFQSDEFKLEFPIFHKAMLKRFEKAIEEKRLLNQCEVFFFKLAEREEDTLPKLQLTCIHKIASYLHVEDMESVGCTYPK